MSDEANDKPASETETPEAPTAVDAPAKVVADAPAVAAAPLAPTVTASDWVFLVGVSVVTAGLDLWSKAWAMGALSRVQSSPPPLCSPPPGMQHYLPQRMSVREITIVHNYLDFQYAENCGGAWGLLHGASEAVRRPFFLLVTVGAIAFIVHLYRGLEKGQTSTKWALPLVLGGAIGNLVDRVRLGYVVDFIHMHLKTRAHWPTYNVADIAITVGIGLMLLEYVIGPKPGAKPAAKPAATAA
jgi:signal peptidase II